MDAYLKKELIDICMRFVSQLELSFSELINEKEIKTIKKYLNSLDNKQLFDHFITTILQDIKEDELLKVVKTKKVKSADLEFLNNIELFNTKLKFIIFKDENKNTKKSLVDNLHLIYTHCNLIRLLDSNQLDQTMIETLTKKMTDLNALTSKTKPNKKSAPRESDGNMNFLDDFIKDDTIMELANDVSKHLEKENINPMTLLSSLLASTSSGGGISGDSQITGLMENITSKVKSKIDTGELNTQQLEKYAKNIMNTLMKQ